MLWATNFSFGKERVVVNSGLLEGDKIKISKQPSFVKFDTLYSEETEYKEFNYTPNFKRPVSIIDPAIADEVKPMLYYDEESNMVRARVKLLPKKSYIALQVTED